MKSAITLVLFIATAFAAAAVGGLFTPGEWYAQLVKPSWNPPAWLFAPVWTLLYISIGVSGWLVWRRTGLLINAAFSVFVAQLVLNGLWSWLFFGLHRPDLAFIDIVLLWASILTTLLLFWRVTWVAGALLIPYLAWVSFATVLNFTLWQLNV
jgi:translocator protein